VANIAVVRWNSSAAAEDLVRLVRVACADDVERMDEELCIEARRRGARLVSLDVADLVRPGLAVLPEAAFRA